MPLLQGLVFILMIAGFCVFGMVNQVYTDPIPTRRFAKCPASITAGSPVFLGTEPAIALDNYQSNTGGATFLTSGTFALSVVGATALSPVTGVKINPGDSIWADGGSYDPVTNVTYGFTLDRNTSSGRPQWGILDPSYVAVGSGLTDSAAWVRILGIA